MKIVIVGGTGLIGSSLVRRLIDDNHEVVVLSRNPQSARSKALPSETRIVKWDARSLEESWANEFEGAGAIVNFAGTNLAGDGFLSVLPERWTSERKSLIRNSRINSGRLVTAAIERATNKPAMLIQASAIGYYGPRGDEILDESAAPGNDFLAAICVEWEQSTEEVERMGVRRVVTRTGLILSTEEGPLARLMPLYRLFVSPMFGSGRQFWSWIHLHDTIEAMHYLIMNENTRGPFNIVSPNPVTNKEFSWTLARTMGRPFPIPAPSFAVKLLVGEVATVVLDGQRMVPARLNELGFDFRYPDLAPALKDVVK